MTFYYSLHILFETIIEQFIMYITLKTVNNLDIYNLNVILNYLNESND